MDMQYLAVILQASPLTIHFGFYNPEDSEDPCYVPRMLDPLGYFVSLDVRDGKTSVYRTERPKVRLKLHPDRAESYHALEPGYTHGIVFEIDDFEPDPGSYSLKLTYSNRQFNGFPGHPLGEMTYKATLPLYIDG